MPHAILDDDGAIVGGIALRSIERGPLLSCGFGYRVAQEVDGRGYAARAVAEMPGLAFGRLGPHRVQAETLPDDARPQRVLERNGFARIGAAPACLHLAGEWQDHVLFQRLA